MTDLMIIIGLTVGSIVAVGLAGVGLLRLVRYRSLRWQLLVVALTPVVAVAVAVAVNVRLMFLSGHDSGVIAVALATAVLLAVLSAGLLLQHITRGSKQLGSRVSLLVAEGTGAKVEDSHLDQPLPLELEQVRRELVEARATLAESRARERNAERARQELVNFLSHDLRTPLAGLRALTEGLEDGVRIFSTCLGRISCRRRAPASRCPSPNWSATSPSSRLRARGPPGSAFRSRCPRTIRWQSTATSTRLAEPSATCS